MFKYIILVFLLTNVDSKCKLKDIYSDKDILENIYHNLSKIFALKYKSIIEEISIYAPLLRCPTIKYQKEIKELFIEEGFVLNTIKDLEKILNYSKLIATYIHEENGNCR